MKHRKRLRKISPNTSQKILAILAIFVFASVLTVVRHGAFALGQIYLTPGSASVNNGANVTLSLRINPGATVDGVTTTITYDKNKLQFVSLDSSGSGFPIELAASGGNGTVQVDRGILSGGVSADALIEKVTFKALTGSGTSSITLAGNSTSGGSYNAPSVSGATITLTTPASAPAPTTPSAPTTTAPKSSGSTPKTSTPSGTSSAPPATTIPKSSTPATPAAAKPSCTSEANKIQFTSANIHISCNQAVKVFIKYGVNGQLLAATPLAGSASTEFNVGLGKPILIPGTTITYRVVVIDSSGAQTEGASQTFFTKGYTVRAKILGKDNKPLAGTNVTLHSNPMVAKTDRSGLAVFQNVAPGNHEVEYASGKTKYSKVIVVADTVTTAGDGTQSDLPQNFSVTFDKVGPSMLFNLAIIGLLAIAALASIAYVLVSKGDPGSGSGGFKNLLHKITPRSAGSTQGLIPNPTPHGSVIYNEPPPAAPVPPDQNKDVHVG